MSGRPNMKLFFIEAPYSYGSGKIVVGKYFPLGLGYLAAHARRHGASAYFFQPREDRDYDAQLAAALQEQNPDMVCVSAMTPSFPRAAAICEVVKKTTRARTVMGGHHVSAVGARVLEQSPHTDFAVIGEGEETLLELAAALEAGQGDLSGIGGLAWRNGGGDIITNAPRGFIDALDALPFPARDLVDMSRFRIHSYIDFGKKSATMITSRGCPFKCMFCSSRLTMGSKYRYRSVDNILWEIREIVDVHGIDHIVFEDDTMTIKRERLGELCEAMAAMPGTPTWYGLSRVDAMDFELATIMRRANCRMVAFGIESGSPEVLERIGKKISMDQAAHAVDACRRAGLRTMCSFIAGFPFDTRETMRMTLDAAIRIGPTIALFFPLTPYPGTEVYDKFLDSSLIPGDAASWTHYIVTSDTAGISVNPEFSGLELQSIVAQWNKKFYFRPTQIFRMIRSVSGFEDFLRLARGGLYLLSTFFKTKN